MTVLEKEFMELVPRRLAELVKIIGELNKTMKEVSEKLGTSSELKYNGEESTISGGENRTSV